MSFERKTPGWAYRMRALGRCRGPMYCPGDHDRFNDPGMHPLPRAGRWRPERHATQKWEWGQRWLRSDHWMMKEQDARVLARRAAR